MNDEPKWIRMVEALSVERVEFASDVASEAAARTLEACLIQEFKPKHNDRQCMRPTKRRDGPNASRIIAHCNA